MLRVIILTICFFGIITFLIGCNNSDDEKPNCGCESETFDTVPSDNFPEVPMEEQKNGLIFFNELKT